MDLQNLRMAACQAFEGIVAVPMQSDVCGCKPDKGSETGQSCIHTATKVGFFRRVYLNDQVPWVKGVATQDLQAGPRGIPANQNRMGSVGSSANANARDG